MKLITLGVAAALAVGSIGLACATPVNLIQNGDFAAPSQTVNAQFGVASYGGTTNHNFITNWQGNNGYEIWFVNAADSTTIGAVGQYSSGGPSSPEKLWPSVSGPPDGASSFIGMDGDNFCSDGSIPTSAAPNTVCKSGLPVQGAITQNVKGLTKGAKYTVSFSWGAGQLQSRNGATTQQLLVSLGDGAFSLDGQQSTGIVDNLSDSFGGWMSASLTFTADSASEWLTFLSSGTPGSLPPFAVLSGVSMVQAVPEPPVLAMFGGGLLGLGLLTVFARRRQQRRDKDGDLAA